ncbi:cobalamin adenosyltransferase [Bacteroidia bacterium]|nr:cobalamin adenosyltransferase [Bacteroidia bacterium]GHT83509.1 cobalamin adenosyltransferase [Bacteroidia bacterium]
MNIYTKTGDNGTTALATGERVAKHHPRVEAYGEIDELSAHLGLLASLQIVENQQAIIKHVQSLLMQCSATLAGSPNDSHFITPKDIQLIENEIDTLQQNLPPLRGFILPGGGAAASHCHIARCVCRRAERRCVAVADNSAPYNNILQLLNRLSDYLFVLARALCKVSRPEKS